MTRTRATVALVLALCGFTALAPSAGADPARPTDDRSEFRCFVPTPVDATTADPCAGATRVPVTLDVVGGDGFLSMRVPRGVAAAVPGYAGEPYLEFAADGTVRENRASSAYYLNESRYGTSDRTGIPEGVTRRSATEHPRWVVVARDGRWVWHDHRIHWMSPTKAPPRLPGSDRIVISERPDGLWHIPVTIDGRAYEALGELRRLPAPSPAPQLALAAVIGLGLALVGRLLRGRGTRVAAGALVLVGGLAVWVGASELAAVPRLAGGNPIWVALPAVTVVTGVIAVILRAGAGRAIIVLAGAAALAVWAVLHVTALNKAVPLGDLDPTVTRTIIATALGTAAGAALAAIVSGALALQFPDLDLDIDDDPTGSAGTPTDDG